MVIDDVAGTGDGAAFPILTGAVLLPAVIVVDLVFVVIAAIKANKGEHYRYPLCIRFIK